MARDLDPNRKIHALAVDQDEWMRPPQAAAYLKSSTSTLAKKRLTGDGVPYTKFGRLVLYAKRDLDESLASHRRLSTSDAGQAGAA